MNFEVLCTLQSSEDQNAVRFPGGKTVPWCIDQLMLRHPKESCVLTPVFGPCQMGKLPNQLKKKKLQENPQTNKKLSLVLFVHGVVEVWLSKPPWPFPAICI